MTARTGHILVTGGAGFIGTHLCRALREAGKDVRVLDLKDAAQPVAGVEYARGDVRSPDDLAKLVKGASAVYHFAAIVNVAECQEKPVESYQTNFMGTVQVLEAARLESAGRGDPVRVIFAGSSAVYGRKGVEGVAIRESDVADEPLSFYASQKLSSEHVIRIYCENRGVPAVVFRFFNVYGHGQDPTSPYSGVITIFSRLTREGKDLHLHGGGKQTRDFISVTDLVRANVRALDLPDSSCDGRAINLGTGRTITIRELGDLIIRLSRSSSKAIPSAPREGDVPHSRADVARALETLGWKSEIELSQGLGGLLY